MVINSDFTTNDYPHFLSYSLAVEKIGVNSRYKKGQLSQLTLGNL